MRLLLKSLKWIVGTLIVVLLLAVGTLAILAALEIRVQLDPLRAPVEAAAEAALGRDIGLDGDIVLVPTLWPTLEVGEVTVANPPHWGDGLFARAGTVRLQLGVAPLLSGEIQIADVTAKDVDLNLENNAEGEPNWRFEIPESKESEPDTLQPKEDGPGIRLTSLNNLTLEDIALNYADKQLGKSLSFKLDRMQGAIPEGQPMTLEIAGSLQEKPFRIELKAGSLDQLVEDRGSWPLTLTGDLAGAPLSAEGKYIQGDEPEISASLNLGSLDFGAFFAWLGIIDGLEATAEQVTARVAIRGDSLAELLATSEIELILEDGAWTLVHPGTGARLDLGIEEGKISIQPAEPVSVSLDTRIDGVPFVIGITGVSVVDMMEVKAPLPLKLTATGGGADLTLSTEVTLPIDPQQGLAFELSLEGQRLSAMNALLKADLPPLGPYALNGVLAFDPQGYAVKDLRVRVADTSLDGELSLDIARKPPYVHIALRSKQLRIDDFLFEGWSPTKGSSQPGAEVTGATDSGEPRHDGAPALMSRETLSSLDAKVSVAVDNVFYGSESLGSGSLLLTLDGGRLSLDPVEVNLPGGGAQASFLFHPMASDTEIALMTKVEKFDYGVLARRIDPESEIAGKLSLNLDLKARASSLQDLLREGEGYFDFGLWPGQMKADLFELWAVNVVSALMSEMDKEESSKVNCVIARFQLKDGVMNDRVIFADTTKMRIEGSAKVDFRERTLNIEAGPKGKKPEFFSLAVPVGLSGKFDDFGIDLNALVLTGKSVSFITSPLHVPLRRIFVKGEPEDGEEACAEVWGNPDAEVSEPGKEKEDEAAGQETEASVGDGEQQAKDSDEQTKSGGLKERFRRFKDSAKEAADESPGDKPAIVVLNLSD